ncbi:cupin domain-containing protein [Pseudoalteromonas luteoviolacea]|uniref:cupin domain-containing protein n=1 Tax=Pseudoalteromonas luteoviolacea TaxID=43657 RepID=UPI001B39A107|nr:cupin domain-containing protein [Pseudoalteromonas luteoviolacea]MBQ4837137.1 cupin domain-containing protein [Pseudoalteromonas luteoviolacea]
MTDNLLSLFNNRQKLSKAQLDQFVLVQWQQGKHFDRLPSNALPDYKKFDAFPWEKIDCMLTKIVRQQEDGLSFGFDMFPPKSAAKGDMHVHPLSSRLITVLEGYGTAIVQTCKGKMAKKEVGPGDVILFPHATPHCFWGAEDAPMVVEVMLGPYVPFEHPLHTVCPKKAKVIAQDYPDLFRPCHVDELEQVANRVVALQAQGLVELSEHQVMEWGDEFIDALGGYETTERVCAIER